jgi:hypothetical protein
MERNSKYSPEKITYMLRVVRHYEPSPFIDSLQQQFFKTNALTNEQEILLEKMFKRHCPEGMDRVPNMIFFADGAVPWDETGKEEVNAERHFYYRVKKKGKKRTDWLDNTNPVRTDDEILESFPCGTIVEFEDNPF